MKRLSLIFAFFIYFNVLCYGQLQLIRSYNENTDRIKLMTFDNKSTILAYVDYQGTISILDYAVDKRLHELRNHAEPINFIFFNPTKSEIISADNNVIVINDLNDISRKRSLSQFSEIEWVEIGPNGNELYVKASLKHQEKSEYIYRINLESNQLEKLTSADDVSVYKISANNDGLYLAKGKNIESFGIANTFNGRNLVGHEGKIKELYSSSFDKTSLLSRDKDNIIYWNTMTGKYIKMNWKVDHVKLLSHEKLLVQLGGSVKIRSYKGIYEEHNINSSISQIEGIICNEAGNLIAIHGDNNKIELWKNGFAFSDSESIIIDAPLPKENNKPLEKAKTVSVEQEQSDIYYLYKSQIDDELELKEDLFAPRGEFEKSTSYETRMAEAKSYRARVFDYYSDIHQRKIELDRQLELTKQRYLDSLAQKDKERREAMITETIKNSYEEFITRIQSIGSYNADSEFFPVTIDGKTANVKIPIDNARNFKSNYTVAKVFGVKQLLDDAETKATFNLKILDPIDGTVYDFGEQKLALYLSIDKKNSLLESNMAERTKPPVNRNIDNRQQPVSEKPVNELEVKMSEYLSQKKYYALIIGISDYMDPSITRLDQPVNDALRFKGVLQKNYTFEENNITLLRNPTRAQIIESFDKLSHMIKEDDNLIIFYAGHGIWDERLRQGYWLPRDAKKDSKAAWLSNGTIRDYVGGIQSKHTLLIADACFSGGIFKTREVFSETRAVMELYKLPSRKAMTSGNMKSVPDKSVFMDYLLKRLRDNEQQFISAEQLFSSFRVAVINNSANGQIPQYGDIREAGDEGGDFVFLKRMK